MSVSFFAVTGPDALTGDITPGLDYVEFNVNATDAREIELALDYVGTEDGDIVAGDLPVEEAAGRLRAVPAKHQGAMYELIWNLVDEAARAGADFVAWA